MTTRNDSGSEKKRLRDAIERARGRELEADYVNALLQRIHDLEAWVGEKDELIRCLERKERRLRIWSVSSHCRACKADHVQYAAFVNRRVFNGSDYGKLAQRLRDMGYFVKETTFREKPPTPGGTPRDLECDFLPEMDLRDLKVPDFVPEDLGKELEQGEGKAA